MLHLQGFARRVARRHLCREAAQHRWARLTLPYDDPYYFGFSGARANLAARTMNIAIRQGIDDIEQLGDRLWLAIATVLVETKQPASTQVKSAVSAAIAQMTAESSKVWKVLEAKLGQFADVDVKPDESRSAIVEAFRSLYRQLGVRVDSYVSGQLKRTYQLLANNVDKYFLAAYPI